MYGATADSSRKSFRPAADLTEPHVCDPGRDAEKSDPGDKPT